MIRFASWSERASDSKKWSGCHKMGGIFVFIYLTGRYNPRLARLFLTLLAEEKT